MKITDEEKKKIQDALNFYRTCPDSQYDVDVVVPVLSAVLAGALVPSDEIELLLRELKLTRESLAYAIEEADNWHDDSHGGPVESEEMDRARALLGK